MPKKAAAIRYNIEHINVEVKVLKITNIKAQMILSNLFFKSTINRIKIIYNFFTADLSKNIYSNILNRKNYIFLLLRLKYIWMSTKSMIFQDNFNDFSVDESLGGSGNNSEIILYSLLHKKKPLVRTLTNVASSELFRNEFLFSRDLILSFEKKI